MGGSGTCSLGLWKDRPWRKEKTQGNSASSCVPIPQGTSPCLPSRGFGGWPGPTQPVWPRGTHMVCEVGQQVLRHVITVEQSEDNPLQVLLIDEAILVKICKEEAEHDRKGRLTRPPRSPGSPGPTEPHRPWRVSEPGEGKEPGRLQMQAHLNNTIRNGRSREHSLGAYYLPRHTLRASPVLSH